MSNKILNGKLISDMVLDDIKYQYSKYENKKCALVVITIGDDPASKVYVNNKKKACEYVGFNFINKKFSKDTSFETIYEYIQEMNCQAYGIIIQLPIISDVLTTKQIDILTKNAIYKECDVDGFLKDSPFIPCTPKGIIRMLDTIKYEYKGKTALIIGRSDIVGKPIAKFLLDRDCTVIQAHSKTKRDTLLRMFSQADLIISAVGKPDLITEEDAYQYFKDYRHDSFYGDFSNKKDRVIIDVGINRNTEGKLCGDLPEEFKAKYSSIYSPVPKGVGPMTVAMLIENVWESFIKLNGRN